MLLLTVTLYMSYKMFSYLIKKMCKMEQLKIIEIIVIDSTLVTSFILFMLFIYLICAEWEIT